jgi:hypothetical protein
MVFFTGVCQIYPHIRCVYLLRITTSICSKSDGGGGSTNVAQCAGTSHPHRLTLPPVEIVKKFLQEKAVEATKQKKEERRKKP